MEYTLVPADSKEHEILSAIVGSKSEKELSIEAKQIIEDLKSRGIDIHFTFNFRNRNPYITDSVVAGNGSGEVQLIASYFAKAPKDKIVFKASAAVAFGPIDSELKERLKRFEFNTLHKTREGAEESIAAHKKFLTEVFGRDERFKNDIESNMNAFLWNILEDILED